MRHTPELLDPVASGLIQLREELRLPGPHPPDVVAAAEDAALVAELRANVAESPAAEVAAELRAEGIEDAAPLAREPDTDSDAASAVEAAPEVPLPLPLAA